MADGIPFALSSYRSASLPISAQQIINWYTQVQRQGMDAKTPAALIGVPGLTTFATIGAGPIRAMSEMDGVLYAVSGTQLYSVSSAGVGTLLGGGIANGTNVVGIANSGTEVIVVDGVNGFSYRPASGYVQIGDVDFTAAKTVTYLNGFFLFDRLGTNRFFSSAADDGRNYDALFFSSAETSSDKVLACLSHQQQLYITGKKSIEIWQFNPNTAGFPWIRYPGAAVQIGVAGNFAATVHKERIFFVGDDYLFYRLEGATPVSQSDPAVAAAWRGYGDISDVVVWGLTWDTQEWIVVTFPTVNKTWVFDASTGFFHERESHDMDMASLSRWRGNVHAKAYSKQLIGDAFENKIGYLDDTVFTEYGNPIQSRAVSPALHRKGEKVYMDSLECLFETGVGLTTGQGSDPLVELDWSDDNGRTFSTVAMRRSLGKIGEYQKTVRFTELGSFDNRNFRLTVSDPVKRNLISAIPKAQSGLLYS